MSNDLFNHLLATLASGPGMPQEGGKLPGGLGGLFATLTGNPEELTPPVDVHESKDKIYITIELPGVEKENIKIDLKGNCLSIQGEKPAPEKDMKILNGERQYGGFSRLIQLSSIIDLQKSDITFKNGVLTIMFSKKPEAQPTSLEIS
jgi:HSP20 family protein